MIDFLSNDRKLQAVILVFTSRKTQKQYFIKPFNFKYGGALKMQSTISLRCLMFYHNTKEII